MDPIDDLRAKIATHGWAVRNVVDPNPSRCLSYTIGLTAHGHPEIVMTGLPPEVGLAFLNIAGDIVVHQGGRFGPGTATNELAEGPPMPVLNVTEKSALTAVEVMYGDVPAVQVVWPDSRGHFPWDEGYANPPSSQPLLGTLVGE